MLFRGVDHAIADRIDDKTRARVSFDLEGELSGTTIS
jgi:hypothetical protein